MVSLTNQEKKVFLFLVILLILGFTFTVYKKTQGPGLCSLIGVLPQDLVRKTLDINKATREELIALPGIGEVTAEAILALRERQGRFLTIDELKSVKGLSDKKVEVLKKYLSVSVDTN